jgi:endonuclease/exonuclease/phosphatase family metal-dependent hydrolase
MTWEFSILTYSIEKGFNMGGRQFVLHRMRDALAHTGADVVFLREAQGEHSSHARRVQEEPDDPPFEFLADSVEPHHAYGRNAIYDYHGNATLWRRNKPRTEGKSGRPWTAALRSPNGQDRSVAPRGVQVNS